MTDREVVDLADSALRHLQALARQGNESLLPLVEAIEARRKEAGRDPFPPAPMLVFAIEACDEIAPAVLAFYSELCVMNDLPSVAGEVNNALADVSGWQARYPELVRPPNYEYARKASAASSPPRVGP